MRLRLQYIMFTSAIFAAILAGCSREMRSGGDRPWQPFQLDRIPQFSGRQNAVAGQPSAGSTEPIQYAGSAGTEGEEIEVEEDPVIAGLLQSGRDALGAENYETAIGYFNEVLEHEPDNTAALYNLGFAYRHTGDVGKAIEFARRAVEADPDRLFVHQNLGFAYEDQGDIGSAIGEFEQELINHPDEPRLAGVAERLALMYLDRGLKEEAFDAASRAVTLGPSQASHHATLSRVHMANGAYDQAASALEQAVVLAPDSAEYRKMLADAYWDAGRLDDARDAYRAAITLEPGLADEIDPERLPQEEPSSSDSDPEPTM